MAIKTSTQELNFIRAHKRKGGTDKELAGILGMSDTAIRTRRYAFRIDCNPRALFERHFKSRYGARGYRDLLTMIGEGRNNCDIARRFGFSREYVRQVKRKWFKPSPGSDG